MDDMNIIAKTSRLIIREFTTKDIDCLYDLYNSWGKITLPGINPLSTDKDEEYVKMKSYIQWMYGFYEVGLWAVCDKESGKIIGRCGAQPSEIDDVWLLELGYMLHKDWINKGLCREAMEAVMDYIRDCTEFEQVAALIHKENRASANIAAKLGLTYEKEYEFNGERLLLYKKMIVRKQEGQSAWAVHEEGLC